MTLRKERQWSTHPCIGRAAVTAITRVTVDTTLTRTNGCEIDRYTSLAPVLLPLVGGPGGG